MGSPVSKVRTVVLKINSHFLQLFLSGSISIIQPEKKKLTGKKKTDFTSGTSQSDFSAMLNTDPRAGRTRNTAHLLLLSHINWKWEKLMKDLGGGMGPQAVPRRELQWRPKGDTTRWSMTVTFQGT